MSAPRSSLGLGSLLVAVVIVLALGVGTVYAAIPNGTGTYRACLAKNTGTVRLINYPKVSTCPKGEKLIAWNAKGPAGAQGPQGPAGPADWNAIPNKPAGFADGVDNEGITGVKVTRVSGPKSAPQADGVTFAYAYCPEGSLLVGGGADIDTGNDQGAANTTHFLSNQPGGPRNWFARAWKQLGSGGTYQTQAFAICLSTEPAGNLSLAGKVTKAATKKGK